MPGRGDSPDNIMRVTFTGLGNFAKDLGAMVLGLQATASTAGVDSWNGSPASCCWPDAGAPDPSTAVAAAIHATCDSRTPGGTGTWPCDPKRIWIISHSAGTAAAMRVACDHSDLIAAAITITGSGLADGFDPACSPAHHVSFLHIHGDADSYEYDNNNGDKVTGLAQEYVSAETDRTSPTRTSTTHQMANFNGCTTLSTTTTGLVYDTAGGATTTTVKDWSGCPHVGGEQDVSVELWKMGGSVHQPTFNNAAYAAMEAWLSARSKP